LDLINNNILKTYSPTLREKETEPGLLAFYVIWPGNGVSLLLQPRSPHGASV